MRNRRGVALLAALWLVVAITVVTLQFSLDARERRTLGLAAAERGQARAAAAGALAMMQARLDYALRTAPRGRGNVAALRSSDPWLGVDSLYSGPLLVDSISVDVRASDLGAQLNVNTLTEDELRTFFGFLLRNAGLADQLAQAILDWRDADDMPRPRGGERDQYLKEGLLSVPANAQFREVDDLLQVRGMTPEILTSAKPFLTTRAAATINLNTAPPEVLRVLPGMSDAILATILGLRAQGRRITSVQQVMQTMQRGRTLTGPQATMNAQRTQQLAARASVETNQVQLVLTARSAPQAQPVRLLAILQRANNAAGPFALVEWREW